MIKKIKKRIYEILETAEAKDKISKAFDIFIMTLIILNVIMVISTTVERIHFQYKYYFRIFEIFSMSIFTLEYLLRLWVCSLDRHFKNTLTGRIKYILTPLAIIDLLAILPFYLPMIISIDLKFIMAVRLFRLFSLFKIHRYSKAVSMLKKVLKKKKEELILIVLIVLFLIVIFSSLIYFFEKDAQPEIFSNIPASIWWTIMTFTTVGYGNVYPVTLMGKIIGALVAFIGIGMFALPAGIIGSGLVEVAREKEFTRDKKMEEFSKGKITKPFNLNSKIEELEKELRNIIKELNLIKKM
jgi:voltage-gated potassium channel